MTDINTHEVAFIEMFSSELFIQVFPDPGTN